MLPDTLPASLAEALSARGYDQLTPVQASVIAPEAAGRDLLVSAQTGSGKTVAFGLAREELRDEFSEYLADIMALRKAAE